MGAINAKNLVAPSNAPIDLEFWPWLRGQSQIILGFIRIGVLITLVRQGYYVFEWLNSQKLQRDSFSILVQLVVIAVLTCLIYVKKPGTPKEDDASLPCYLAERSVRQFWEAFLILFVFFAALYADLFVANGNGMSQWLPTSPAVQSVCKEVRNWFNNVSTLIIVICYTILRHRTLDIPRRSLWKWGLGALVLLLVVAGLEHWANRAGTTQVEDAFGWLSAAAACVAISLLTQELGSPEIGAPPSLVAVLYCYAGVQLTWPFVIEIAESVGLEPIGLIGPLVALIGKCVMALIVVWSFDSRRLEFYMLETRERLDTVGRKRIEFLKQTHATISANSP